MSQVPCSHEYLANAARVRYPAALLRCKLDAPSVCCGVFDYVVHPYAEDADCYNGEIIRKDMDKGKAMERVCEYYGADMADTVAFGDSMNDQQMLEYAGIAVAMGNSCQELKDCADVVCESVDEDGVYFEFKRMNLI